MLNYFGNIRERRRNFLLQMAQKYNWTSGAEIGVLAGWTHWFLLDNLPRLSMIGVDSWQPRSGSCKYGDAGMMEAAKRAFNEKSAFYPGRSRVINAPSVEAAGEVPDESLDFVFIDADHTYEACRADILAWAPKVKRTGWIAGHDYHEFPGVKKAVDEVLGPVSCADTYSDDVWARPKATPEVTVCCLKAGTKYGPEYVNILYAMVQRNVHMAGFDFVCFTDDRTGIHPHIRTAPLPYDDLLWWSKMGLYKERIPGIRTPKILYLDLDVAITSCLDPLIESGSYFAMARDWPAGLFYPNDKRSFYGQSSVIFLMVGSHPEIWDAFQLKGKLGFYGDQEWINAHFFKSMDLFPDDLIKSYKLHKLAGENVPDCLIAMFHGQPKPPECGGWVKDIWHE
jgi:hypothetical protein